MIENSGLFERPNEYEHFSDNIRNSIRDQLCDNQSAFEYCVRKVLGVNNVPFDSEKLYAFGKAGVYVGDVRPDHNNVQNNDQNNDQIPKWYKFQLMRLTRDGISSTQIVRDWTSPDSNPNNGWPIYSSTVRDSENDFFLAELTRTRSMKPGHISLFIKDTENIGNSPTFHKWKVNFDLHEEYLNALENLSDNNVENLPDDSLTTLPENSLQSLYDNSLKELIDKNKQIIFTGAPGTGKTFGIRKAIDRLISETPENVPDGVTMPARTKFVQFHSSYDYSDFVEGLRPVSLAEGQNPTFVRMDGVFMKFCRDVAAYNLAILKSENKVTNLDDWYKKCKLSADATQDAKELKRTIKNKILDTQFYFVIDEINRADIGKVLGELMFGLEEDYRGIENRFETQYSNLSTYYRTDDNRFVPYEQKDDVFAKGFFIPENVHIVGSMNNIDRSVDSFDFALRRRFQWHEVTANGAMKPVLIGSFIERQVSFSLEQLEELCKYIDKLNTTISGEGKQLGLNESYHIGPAYFKNYEFGEEDENRAKREEIWNAGIKHILREYVNGRNEDKVEAFMVECEKAFIDGPVEA